MFNFRFRLIGLLDYILIEGQVVRRVGSFSFNLRKNPVVEAR